MTKNKNLSKNIEKTSFEESISRLEEIVEILSSKKISLEEMIDLNEEGNLLKKHCEKRLEEAKMKIEVINQ